jgi:hypothetical protein
MEAVGAKRPWREVMRMPFSKAKQRRRSPNAVASQDRRWSMYRAEMAEQLKHSAQEMRRRRHTNGTTLKECVCQGCRKRWPKAEPFFPRVEKRNGTGTHVYHARVCKLCRNGQRREKSLRQRSGSQATSAPKLRLRASANAAMKCAS